MNMKKIISSVAASALAVSAMATAVFAAGPMTASFDQFSDDGSGNYQVFMTKDGENVTGVDVTKIASIDVTLSWDSSLEWAGGAIVSQCDAASWNIIGQFSSADDGKEFSNVQSGKAIHVDFKDAFAADSTYVIFTFQNYATGNINIDSIKVNDKDGNVLWDSAAPAAAPAETTAAEAAPEATTAAEAAPAATEAPADNAAPAAPADDKGNADTGIEGVAVVAALAVLAGGAIVVAKKRK